MITPELLGYIRGEMAKGRNRAEINGALLAGGGWSEDDLSEAFKEIIPLQGNVSFNREEPKTSFNPTPISIVPPLSSSKPFIPPVLNAKPISATPVASTPSTPVTPTIVMKSNTTVTPPPSSVPPVQKVQPMQAPIQPAQPIQPIQPAPSMRPIEPTQPIQPIEQSAQPVQPQQPKSSYSFSAPVYSPKPTSMNASSPSPVSSVKQVVLPTPPPTPPHSLPLLKFLIIFIILLVLGLALWYFRIPLIDFSNSLMETIL